MQMGPDNICTTSKQKAVVLFFLTLQRRDFMLFDNMSISYTATVVTSCITKGDSTIEWLF